MADTYTVELTPKGNTFGVSADEPILRAAERQGVVLRYGCRHGNCSSCKYQLEEGDVDFGNASPYSLSEGEREEGWALLCCAFALEDLVIHDDHPPDPRARPLLTPRELTAEVRTVEALSPEVWQLRLALPEPIEFYSGQFAELGVPGTDDQWRSYSIASPPQEADQLEFLIKSVEGGAFSGQLDSLAVGDPMRIRAPLGDAYLRSGDDPVLCVGIGTGLAPLLSMLRDAEQREDGRSFTLVYGARDLAGLVLYEEVAALAKGIDLTVVGCLTQVAEEEPWAGFRGRVTNGVQANVGDATALDTYLCGKPEMCADVQRLLEAKGADEHRIYADPFYPAIED